MNRIHRIATLQAGFREVGRIRLGDTQEFKRQDGSVGTRPSKLTTFRLTSRDETALRAAADIYGGKVQRWQNAPAGFGDQWELVIESPFLDVLIPPNGYDSAFEMWSGGGCARRCDGIREELSGGKCLCPEDPRERMKAAQKGEACKPISRLRVMLPKLPGIGSWRLQTGSYYAAIEISAIVDFIEQARINGYNLPVRIHIEERSTKRPDEHGKPVTQRYTVPVISIVGMTPAQMLGSGEPVDLPALGSGIPDLPSADDEPEVVEGLVIADTTNPGPVLGPLSITEFSKIVGPNMGPVLSLCRGEYEGKGPGEITAAQRGELVAFAREKGLIPEETR